MHTPQPKWLSRSLLTLILAAMVLSACGGGPTEAQPSEALPHATPTRRPLPASTPIPKPSPTGPPIQVSFTVTIPYWTEGEVYVGVSGNPAYLRLQPYNEAIYVGNAILGEGEAYYYSRGSSETKEAGPERRIEGDRVTDAVTGWQDDARSGPRQDFQKSFFVAACHFCNVSYTKGNFIAPIGRSMDEIIQDGGNWVSFMPTWFIVPDYRGNQVMPIYSEDFQGTTGWVTSTIRDQDLIQLITMAHDRNLKVYVCPALAPEDWGPGVKAKGDLEPSDPDAFFASYKAFINHYADLAEQTGVEMLCVGSENDTLTQEDLQQNSAIDKTARWRDVIAEARQRYSGLLTYSVACISEERCGPQLIQFWDDLDVIGWEWYVPIASGENQSIETMRQNAERIVERNILPLYERYRKPIVITEMGWEAYAGACAHTYGAGPDKGADRMEQASCYEAVFQAIEGADFIRGVHIFTWTASLEGDTFPWVWTDTANEVRFTITEDMIAKWYYYFETP